MKRSFLMLGDENDKIEPCAIIERLKKARALNREPEELGLVEYFLRRTMVDSVNILSHRCDVAKKI